MGTVGISFGSPTSGTGFDVSATVSQIVANLANVETPWKTQLTSLDSQDTVLSSLGTLLSSLSTDMSQLTDFSGVMAEKTGSSSDTNVLELTAATSSAVAGTHTVVVNSLATTSSGYLAPITNSGDTLSGSITLQVGTSGTEQTIDMSTLSNQTLAGLAAAINSSGAGIAASVLTDSSGSRLSVVSGTSGAIGDITVSANSIADSTTSSGTLAYSSPISGADASLTVDGVTLSSASNTVANLIPGVTFQLLAPSAKESDGSLEQVQVVIGNDNSGVESAISQMVTDYNSLVSAMNTQEGNDNSGNAEPLFGSPTLTLLQQQLMGSLNAQNPNGYLTSIAVNSSTALTGSMTVQAGSGPVETIVIGAAPVPPAPNHIYTGSGVNTLQGLADAINAAAQATPINYASTATDSGTITASNTSPLTGTLEVETGSGSTETIYLGLSSDAPAGDLATGNTTDTLPSLETYINKNSSALGVTASIVDNGDGTSTLSLTTSDSSALTVTSGLAIPGLGVNAGITTANGQSTLSLMSETAGSAGALNVTSSMSATGDTLLGFTGISGGGGYNASGALDPISSASDVLSGSITIQVGDGTAQTVTIGSSANTMQSLAEAINGTLGIGVTASVDTNSDGTAYLALESQTAGTAGNLTVTSNVLDTTNTTTTALNYNNSSDLSTLANLGITVSQTDDGSLTFDASVLDSVLNSDYSSVVGFFQNANSWGQSFAATLENAGTSSPSGVLALAQLSNSSTESTLNAEVSKEQSYISAQQTSLTAELNSANEILQQLPSELQGVNELYSAITGYNQNASS